MHQKHSFLSKSEQSKIYQFATTEYNIFDKPFMSVSEKHIIYLSHNIK